MENQLLLLKRDLSLQELSLFEIEYRKRKRNGVTMWLLWLFTGGCGGHRYYLGDRARAVAHTVVFLLAMAIAVSPSATPATSGEVPVEESVGVLVYLLIPGMWALFDGLFLASLLRKRNEQIEMKIISDIKATRS